MSYKTISLCLSTALFWTIAAQAQISPTAITLGPGQHQQFSVPSQAPIWTIVPAGTGTITTTGLYTAPSNYTFSYVYVYAKVGSLSYQTKVSLTPTQQMLGGTASSDSGSVPVSISVNPASIYLYAGQSTQFTATVGGTYNQQVAWSILLGPGSIVNGLYTAPSTVTGDSLVTISATSAADPTKTASATILLGPAVGQPTPTSNVTVLVRPRGVSLSAGQSRQFNATVGGTTNTAVTWSLSPNVGSIVNGLYTAPANISNPKSVTITATSAANATVCASVTVSLLASSAPAVTPPPPVRSKREIGRAHV